MTNHLPRMLFLGQVSLLACHCVAVKKDDWHRLFSSEKLNFFQLKKKKLRFVTFYCIFLRMGALFLQSECFRCLAALFLKEQLNQNVKFCHLLPSIICFLMSAKFVCLSCRVTLARQLWELSRYVSLYLSYNAAKLHDTTVFALFWMRLIRGFAGTALWQTIALNSDL